MYTETSGIFPSLMANTESQFNDNTKQQACLNTEILTIVTKPKRTLSISAQDFPIHDFGAKRARANSANMVADRVATASKTVVYPEMLADNSRRAVSTVAAQFPILASPLATPPQLQIPSNPLPMDVDSDNGKRTWHIIKSLGKGGCGEVYLAQELNSDSPLVALKIIKERKQFLAELAIMRQLNKFKGDQTVARAPKLFCACRKRKALIMEYLGDNLAMKFEQCGFRFSLKTLTMLMMEMLELSRDFYQKTGFIHVDLKPANYCVGSNGRSLSLIDFGYSTSPQMRLPSQTGTPLFMSWSIQTIGRICTPILKLGPCWQDDIESLGYVLMFLIGGGKTGLPWGKLKTHRDIAAAKSGAVIHEFCSSLMGTEYELMAQPLSNLLSMTRSRMRPFNMIDFVELYRSFEQILVYCGWSLDYDYDWCHLPSKVTLHPEVPRLLVSPFSPFSPVN